ncbi:Alpha-2-macroglobulin [Taenia solium]|eukprot:TsM_000310600 transcript=TsM_000310600 gene=TsM_000310600
MWTQDWRNIRVDMRRLASQLLALICTVATGAVLSPPKPDQYVDTSNAVTISLSQELFIDMPSRISIHSEKPIFKVTVNMQIQGFQLPDFGLTTFNQPVGNKSIATGGYTNDLKYHVPIELEPGSSFYLTFTYLYCSSRGCKSGDKLMEKSITKSDGMVQKFVVIMGETDKPIYRPGDRHLLPHSEPPTWPKYRNLGGFWQSWRLRPTESAECERRLQPPRFDSIEMRDPLDNIVHRWKNVLPLDALNLAHNLISDAKEGEWKIEARVRDCNEAINFIVAHYTLPRFQAYVEFPQSTQLTKSDVVFSVCAAYTDGPFVRATFDAQICICDEGALERQQKGKTMFSRDKCISKYDPVMRTCMRVSGKLDGVDCTNTAVNTSQLTQDKTAKWNEKLGVFVEVVEDGTGSSAFASGVTELRRWSEPRVELILPITYRNGLPIVGQVVCRNPVNSGDDELEVYVDEILDVCDVWGNHTIDHPTILLKNIPFKAGIETYDIVLPPSNLQKPIRVTARRIRRSSTSRGDVMPRNFTGFAIQVTVVNTTSVTCPGRVNLQVLSNKALTGNTTLMLQFLSRGQLTIRTIELEADYACLPQDNEFGHYEWGGANCLTPVCDGIGCGIGGICVAPGRCACKRGWKGANCEIHAPRQCCENGICTEGECVCQPGFAGPQCDRAVVIFEEVNEAEKWHSAPSDAESGSESDNKNSEHRTFFKHKCALELDGGFGPDLRAVAFVINDGEMASDFVQIGGLPTCSSPAMAETEHGGGLQFNKQLVVPGENVSMSLTVPTGKASNEELANSCLLSSTDVSSNQFFSPNFHRIDFDAYAGLLRSNQLYTQESEIKGTEDAFHAAGMEVIPVLSQSKFHRVRGCEEEKIAPKSPSHTAAIDASAAPGLFVPHTRNASYSPRRVETRIRPLRIRDFFPEVWLFETARLTNASLNKSLTAPDTLTTWEANALCFTKEKGLWTPVQKPQLAVRMPFFVETTANTTASTTKTWGGDGGGNSRSGVPRTCYEVNMGVETNSRDWRVVGVSSFTTCICVGGLKQTFQLFLCPLRVGLLNVTAMAVGRSGNSVCGDADGDAGGSSRAETNGHLLNTLRNPFSPILRHTAVEYDIPDVTAEAFSPSLPTPGSEPHSDWLIRMAVVVVGVLLAFIAIAVIILVVYFVKR